MAKQSLLPFSDREAFFHNRVFNPRQPWQGQPLLTTKSYLGCHRPDKETVATHLHALKAGRGVASTIAATVLANRGVQTDSSLAEFLSPGADLLPIPSRFLNFNRASDLLIPTIRLGEKMGIVGVGNVDGLTAVAQLSKTMQDLNAPHHYWIPNRVKDGYGISARIVEDIAEQGCQVVVLLGHGVKAHSHIAELRARGITVIVLDHQEVSETLPDAIVVDPRQPGCALAHEYPSTSGLSFFLSRRIRSVMGLPRQDLSLAALGTVAGALPLTGLNRHITHTGLQDIRRGSNPGLEALAAALRVSCEQIVTSDLGFLMGPAVNAAEHLDDASVCVELFNTADRKRASEIASHLVNLHSSQHHRGVDGIDTVMEPRNPHDLKEVAVMADATLTLRDITPGFVSRVEALLGPTGSGFEPPQYLLQELRVTDIEPHAGGRYMVEVEQNGCLMRAFVGPELWNNDLFIGATLSLVATASNVYKLRDQHVQLRVAGYSVKNEDSSQTKTETQANHPDTTPSQKKGSFQSSSKELVHAEQHANAIPQFLQLLDERDETIRNFDSRYIYPDLVEREPDPFCPPSKEQVQQWWREEVSKYGLQLNTAALEYRPAAVEFVRYFFDRGGSHILEAPTGSGKTEIALTVASHFRNRYKRVVFLAPTIDIVGQTAARIAKLLGEEAVVLDGARTSPAKRQEIYSKNPGCIVATPHVIANDLQTGAFRFSPDDLLIVDEAHNATGGYPAVSAIKAARSIEARILALSATPAQVMPGGSWEKLDDLKELVGTTSVFPLNVPTHRPDLRSVKIQLSPEMEKAREHLASLMGSLQREVLREIYSLRYDDLLKQAEKLFGKDGVSFPSSYAMRSLQDSVLQLSNRDKWPIRSLLNSIGELSELHHCLVQQGISAFLLRCVHKRFEIFFPQQARAGQRTLAPSRSIQVIYSDRSINSAFAILSNSTARKLWGAQAQSELMGCQPPQWASIPKRERTTRFNRAVLAAKERVVESLLTQADFWDHPKEKFVIDAIGKHGRRTFISVRDRDHAVFFAKRINALLSERGIHAVPLTGKGEGARKGISASERTSNLAAFNDGRASVIVGTSASNEGVDIDAEHGYIVVFDGSQTSAKQKEGRVGRRALGKVDYLCTTLEDQALRTDYLIVLQILRKDIAFLRLLNNERAKVTSLAGLASLPARSAKSPGKERNLSLFDRFTGA